MDKTTDYKSRNSNIYKATSRRNHITERNLKKQHERIESMKKTTVKYGKIMA